MVCLDFVITVCSACLSGPASNPRLHDWEFQGRCTCVHFYNAVYSVHCTLHDAVYLMSQSCGSGRRLTGSGSDSRENWSNLFEWTVFVFKTDPAMVLLLMVDKNFFFLGKKSFVDVNISHKNIKFYLFHSLASYSQLPSNRYAIQGCFLGKPLLLIILLCEFFILPSELYCVY